MPVIPAKAGIQCLGFAVLHADLNESPWIPAFAGMTSGGNSNNEDNISCERLRVRCAYPGYVIPVYARHSRASGNPVSWFCSAACRPERKSLDSRFRGNDEQGNSNDENYNEEDNENTNKDDNKEDNKDDSGSKGWGPY